MIQKFQELTYTSGYMNTYTSVGINEAVFSPQSTMGDTINKTKFKTPIELIQKKNQMGFKKRCLITQQGLRTSNFLQHICTK